jgi:FkbH-like protein
LPVPSDFKASLHKALAANDQSERIEILAALAQHRLDFLQTTQVARALGQPSPDRLHGFWPVRLAILSASTVDHLVPAIRVAGLRRRLLLDVHVGPYGQHRQQLLDPGSSLEHFAPQVILLSLTAREPVATSLLGASAAEIEETVARSVDELRALWRIARDRFRATVIQQTFLNFAEPIFGSYDRLVPGTPFRRIARLNDRLAEAAALDQVHLLDVARASERTGLESWFDLAHWLQARIEIAHRAAPMYGELAARVIGAQRGLSKKCLVLDLDNTLWGGVIGDDGIHGIVLAEGSPVGEAHLSLQRYARQLRERGVILAVCSKNDPATAESVFAEHPEMLLRRNDFAAFVANWEDKAVNLSRIASQLNIGLDALVFMDDNPAERARIRESLPMVAVPELPEDAAQYVRCLADAGYFEAVAFTSEDLQRGSHYSENASRDAFLASSGSLKEFLRGLNMSVKYGHFQKVDLPRIAQLISKTNQFNPTTRRHSIEDVVGFLSDERCVTLQYRLVDKFGDNGLVSAMILRPVADEPDILEIDTWVMSCRVFGRELEFEAMNIAVEAARQRRVTRLRADYLPTAKNAVVRELYAQLGFVRASHPASESGASRWVLALSDYTPRPTHIARSSTSND